MENVTIIMSGRFESSLVWICLTWDGLRGGSLCNRDLLDELAKSMQRGETGVQEFLEAGTEQVQRHRAAKHSN